MSVYTCNLLLCPSLLGCLACSWLEIEGISIHGTVSTHRELSGRGTQKAGNHPASISASVTHIACSWPRLVQQQLPAPFPTLMQLQSLVCTSKAHRQCKLWTRVQTSHMQCLLKIQRVQHTPSASPEQAGRFCTAIHLCQVLRHYQAAQLCSYPPCNLPHSNCFASASEPRKSVLDCRPWSWASSAGNSPG